MRVEGWERLLNTYIDQAHGTTFEWGRHDCALWSADWVAAVTGADFASPWRGRYASEAELQELLAGLELGLPSDVADGTGFPQVGVAFAQRGDVVLHPQGCLGICNGTNSYFLMERGVTRFRTRDCVKAWKVR